MTDVTKHVPRQLRHLPAVRGAVLPCDLPPSLRDLEAEQAAEAEPEAPVVAEIPQPEPEAETKTDTEVATSAGPRKAKARK